MSGYESIRDWAFDNYDFNDYDTFQKWLDAIESDFDLNGRGIPLRKIFDNQDYIDLENEWNERTGTVDEDLDDLLDDEIIEEEERKEELQRQKEEIEEKIRKDELNIVESFVESVVDVGITAVEKVTGFFKGLFGR